MCMYLSLSLSMTNIMKNEKVADLRKASKAQEQCE